MAKKKSTAIARRRPTVTVRPLRHGKRTELAKRKKDEATALMPKAESLVPDVSQRILNEQINLGALGLVEVKLTPKEEAVLNEPVKASEVRIKPTKDGAVYLPHTAYTRWFNRAFGRLGWALVPAGTPMVNDKSVVQPFIFHIHGKPVQFAYGEQDYHESNKQQTYGDAIESTVASALRRIAKRMGVGLELWEAQFGANFRHEFGVKVWCGEGDKGGFKWRMKTDPPFWDEHSQGRPKAAQERPARAEKPVMNNPKADEPITAGQTERLWTIARRMGRTDDECKAFLKQHYGYNSSKEIQRKHYDNIVKAIEQPGPLQMVLDAVYQREIGEEG